MDSADRGGGGSDPLRRVALKRRGAPNWLRLISILLGIGVITWLTVEDPDARNPLIAGALISLTGGMHVFHRLDGTPCHRVLLRYGGAGLLLGLSAPLLASILMLFKSGLHGHGFPEYIFQDYVTTYRLLPLFGAVGLVAGIALGTWRWVRCQQTGEL
ncbi:MAG: hypothetical protein R3335_05850 [Anaerolineales bacterium]|nr:hypothetical protein [Anaerolineales bacterium]